MPLTHHNNHAFIKSPLTLLILLIVSFFNFTPAYADSKNTDLDTNATVGKLAPDFVITRLDGSEFHLKDYRGKKSVYLMFWNTWCSYCHKKIPLLKQVQEKFNQEIVILAINTSLSDTVDKMTQFKSERQLNYPIAFDHGKKSLTSMVCGGRPLPLLSISMAY